MSGENWILKVNYLHRNHKILTFLSSLSKALLAAQDRLDSWSEAPGPGLGGAPLSSVTEPVDGDCDTAGAHFPTLLPQPGHFRNVTPWDKVLGFRPFPQTTVENYFQERARTPFIYMIRK